MKNEIEKRKLIAVLTISDVASAVPVAKAIFEGGVSVIELTLRTPEALDCIKVIRKEVPEMLVGAGTILSLENVLQAKEAGAHFGVAPGTNPRVIKAAKDAGLFFGPGVFTPSDIEIALENDCTLLKYFPAASCGMNHLKAMSTPYKHLGVKFIPLGGVNLKNLSEMLSDSLIAAVGGSWLATPELINAGKFDEIYANAKAAAQVIKECK